MRSHSEPIAADGVGDRMSTFDDDSAKELIDKLQELTEFVANQVGHLRKMYPDVDERRDLRLTGIGRLGGALASTVLGLHHLRHNLMKVEWWQANSRGTDPQSAIVQTQLFEEYLKIGCGNMVFVCLESVLRSYSRAWEPEKKAARSFGRVYPGLLNMLPPLDRHVPAIELFSEIRNSLHNNGVWMPYGDYKSLKLAWRGRAFEFEIGQRLEFVSWELLIEIWHELADLIVSIAAHPRCKRHEEELTDISLPGVDEVRSAPAEVAAKD